LTTTNIASGAKGVTISIYVNGKRAFRRMFPISSTTRNDDGALCVGKATATERASLVPENGFDLCPAGSTQARIYQTFAIRKFAQQINRGDKVTIAWTTEGKGVEGEGDGFINLLNTKAPPPSGSYVPPPAPVGNPDMTAIFQLDATAQPDPTDYTDTAPESQCAIIPYEPPVLSPADTAAVLAWINKRVATSKNSYCYRRTYMNPGTPISVCNDGQEKDGALCYPKCRAGYDGVGPVCWETCRSGYTDWGVFCAKGGSSYSNDAGIGSCPWSGYMNMGLYCYNWAKVKSREKVCPAGSYYNAGICRKRCQAGETNWGALCVRDIDSYGKDSYGRGAGNVLGCKPGTTNVAGLCYTPAREGYHNVAGIAWPRSRVSAPLAMPCST
jgi:hypothetical protein